MCFLDVAGAVLVIGRGKRLNVWAVLLAVKFTLFDLDSFTETAVLPFHLLHLIFEAV